MRVRVKLYGQLKILAKEEKIDLPLPQDATLRDLLGRLGEKYGPELKEKLKVDYQAYIPPLLIWIGGRDHRFCGGLDRILKEEDTIDLLPPAVGG
jgi:molybdopterin converting factor small subunit